MENNLINAILLDTDAVINFFNNSNEDITKKIFNYKNKNNAELVVTYLTWYELFKSTQNQINIIKKLKLIKEKSDGFIIHDDIGTDIDSYLNPESWLQFDQFPIADFLKFILFLQEIVFRKINLHILDTLLVTVHAIFIFDHISDLTDKNKAKATIVYKSFIRDARDVFSPMIVKLLSNNNGDKKYYMQLLYEVYKSVKSQIHEYNEGYEEFIERIRKIKHNDILISFRRINNESGGKVIYDLTDKNTLFDSIYDEFYSDSSEETVLKKCKKFLFKNNPIYGGKFDINDYIDASNFLLVENTKKAKLIYYTEDKKWKDFINHLGSKYLINFDQE
ncbi:MAG: hypothetical protein ABII85_01515 [Bacillota bacterium]